MGKFIDMDKLVLPKGTVDKIQKRGVPAILDWLAEQKSIEVVYCRECKYNIGKYYCPETDADICDEPNAFCSHGERKEAE